METQSLRKEYLFLAKLAEKTERFDDMVNYMHKLALEDSHLKSEERELLAIAYKNVVGPNRLAWRAVIKVEINEENSESNAGYLQLIREYKKKIENEILRVSEDLQDVTSQSQMPSSIEDPEGLIFYNKLKGDYSRYIAEVTLEDKFQKAVSNAQLAYKSAWEMCKEHLKGSDTLRLGVALNYAVFFFEVMNEPLKAIRLAKDSQKISKEDMEMLGQAKNKQNLTIYKLIKDNISQWENEMEIIRQQEEINKAKEDRLPGKTPKSCNPISP